MEWPTQPGALPKGRGGWESRMTAGEKRELTLDADADVSSRIRLKALRGGKGSAAGRMEDGGDFAGGRRRGLVGRLTINRGIVNFDNDAQCAPAIPAITYRCDR